MGILNFLKANDINSGVAQFRNTENALLLDVRTRQEYATGHIPGSLNVPLQRLEDIEDEIAKDTPLFVHCLSGGRSRQAVSLLREMGYHEVSDIGGINKYKGALEV